MVNALSAANAYRNQIKLQEGIKDSQGGEAEAHNLSFGDLLKDAAQGAINTQHQAEAVSMESLTGKVELSDLVTAVTNAEMTLNTVVAVRDRVINAYQEIVRMPI